LFPAEVAIGDRIARHCQDRGLMIRPIAHLNVLSPPLILSREQIDAMIAVMRESTLATLDDLKRDGLY
jgi:adenosylmethionine-8-amino-7-oxononanoate aminotransferase